MKKTLLALTLGAFAASSFAYTLFSNDGSSVRYTGYLYTLAQAEKTSEYDYSETEKKDQLTNLEAEFTKRLFFRHQLQGSFKFDDNNKASFLVRGQKNWGSDHSYSSPFEKAAEREANLDKVKYTKSHLTARFDITRYFLSLENKDLGTFTYGKNFTVAGDTFDGLYGDLIGVSGAQSFVGGTKTFFEHAFRYDKSFGKAKLSYSLGYDRPSRGEAPYTLQHGVGVNFDLTDDAYVYGLATYQMKKDAKGETTARNVFTEAYYEHSVKFGNGAKLSLLVDGQYTLTKSGAKLADKTSGASLGLGAKLEVSPYFRPYVNFGLASKTEELVAKDTKTTSKSYGVSVGASSTLATYDSFALNAYVEGGFSKTSAEETQLSPVSDKATEAEKAKAAAKTKSSQKENSLAAGLKFSW